MSLSTGEITTTDPAHLIDDLLQGTLLFVMEILHNKALKRDPAFYRRGCGLVETLQEQLKKLNASDEFTDHMLYAQCSLIDEAVLNSAPKAENHVWLAAPLQAQYIGTMHAGEAIPERLRRLLRQPAPDRHLLVLYQRIFAMGFGRFSPEFKQERCQFIASLDALVPVAEQSLSTPLLVELRPGVSQGLLRSRIFHIVILAGVTAALWYGLSRTLSSFLHSTFSG